MEKRYKTISQYLKNKYDVKIVKLSLDGGFTCPNRDGKLDTRGCLFCSEQGSGEYAGAINRTPGQHLSIFKQTESIAVQVQKQKELLSEKWPVAKYIAYFQNFTNTYGPVGELEALYDSALVDDDVLGLVISTRPDCIDASTIELFKKYNEGKLFWVELGLQTIKTSTIDLIRRHYQTSEFELIYQELIDEGIPVVLHVILGLPGESYEDMMNTVKYVSGLKPFGVKFHMLNVLLGSDLEIYYHDHPFEIMSREEYINTICDAIEWLDPQIVIHRVTGDGPRDLLIAPQWIKNKRAVLNGIDQELRRRNTFQGSRYLNL